MELKNAPAPKKGAGVFLADLFLDQSTFGSPANPGSRSASVGM